VEKRKNNTAAGGGGAAASAIAHNDSSIKVRITLHSWSDHTTHNSLSDFKQRQ